MPPRRVATHMPTAVRTTAAASESADSSGLYPLGMPGVNAIIAMKCVAQMPNPVELAAIASQTRRFLCVDRPTWRSRLTAEKEEMPHISVASATSLRSCWFTMQL